MCSLWHVAFIPLIGISYSVRTPTTFIYLLSVYELCCCQIFARAYHWYAIANISFCNVCHNLSFCNVCYGVSLIRRCEYQSNLYYEGWMICIFLCMFTFWHVHDTFVHQNAILWSLHDQQGLSCLMYASASEGMCPSVHLCACWPECLHMSMFSFSSPSLEEKISETNQEGSWKENIF